MSVKRLLWYLLGFVLGLVCMAESGKGVNGFLIWTLGTTVCVYAEYKISDWGFCGENP